MEYKLYWTDEALRNLDEILVYLANHWTHVEINHFKQKLSKMLDLIINNPFLFPISVYNKRLRKAVLSKQTTIFYEVKDNKIYLAYLFVNKKSIGRISKRR